MVDGQNFIYCVGFEENIQKPHKKLLPENVQILIVFDHFLLTEGSKSNSDLMTLVS